jgi:hypothetical protein
MLPEQHQINRNLAEETQGQKSFPFCLLLKWVWWGASWKLCLEVLISCENWFPSFGTVHRLRVYYCLGERDKGQMKWDELTRKWEREKMKGDKKEPCEVSFKWSAQCAFTALAQSLSTEAFWFVLTFSLCEAFHLIMSTSQSTTAWLMLHFHGKNFNSTSSALNAHPIMRLSW